MSNKANCSQSYAEDYTKSENDPDIAVASSSPLITDGKTTIPGTSIEAAVITRRSDQAAFPCIAIMMADGNGLHFMFTPEGARQFAAGLLSTATEAEQALQQHAAEAMARITGKGGAA